MQIERRPGCARFEGGVRCACYETAAEACEKVERACNVHVSRVSALSDTFSVPIVEVTRMP